MSTTVLKLWQLSYGIETQYGTEAAPDQYLLGKGGESNLNVNLKRIRDKGNRGYYLQLQGKKDYSGNFWFYVQNGKFFKCVLGKVTDEGTGPFTHTIEEDETVPSFTLEDTRGNYVRRFLGCKVSRMVIRNEVDDELRCEIDWISQSHADYTSGTSVTDVTTVPYKFSQGVITINSQQVDIVRSFEWTFDQGLSALFHLGSEELTHLPECARSSEVSMPVTLTDKTYWDLLKDDTEFSASILYTRGTSDTFKIEWLNCKLAELPQPLPEDADVMVQTLQLWPKSTKITVMDNIETY